MHAYDSYRDSGIPWLRALPCHWGTVRLRRLVEIKKRIAGEEGPDVLSITQRGIKVRDTTSNDGQLASSYAHYQLVEPDDFAMNHMDLLTGWVDISPRHGVTSPDYRVFSVRRHAKVDSRYLLRVLQLGYTGRTFFALGQGSSHLGRWRLPADAFNDFEVPLPPLAEQTAIAAFLDRETAKIDALVEAQRLLIELLKEKRQVVISHAVTKGLDLTAPMKPSGVDWLGEVPAHWEVKRLRFVADISTGDGDTADAEEEGEFPFYVRSPVIERIGRFTHDCEAVLTSGDGAGVGKIFHHVVGKFATHQRVYIFNRFRGMSAKFFFHYLRENFFKVALEGGAKSTVDSLRRPLIANFWMTVPPADEQAAIVSQVENISNRFEELTSEAEAAIRLLQERRGALIAAAVTGKVDARQEAASSTGAADQGTARRLAGAAVLELVADNATSGRMTPAKRMYLAEAHAGLWELRGQPERKAAGPFDSALMSEVETELARVGHIATSQPGGPGSQVHYSLTGTRGALRAELDTLLGDRRAVFDRMLADLSTLESKGIEAVATLYAVWNDMLIDGQTPTDDAVINGVLNDWHAEKRDKFTRPDLVNYLGWMRRHDLTPSGRGPRTKSGALL